jgi:hypothetical protein
MQRMFAVVVFVAAALFVPISGPQAMDADTLTCSGEYATPVLHGGFALAGPFDIHCWRVEMTPLVVTPLVTGSAEIKVFNNGLCTLGIGSGTLLVSFRTNSFQESYTADFVMTISGGVAQLVIRDGTSSEGADSAEGTGEMRELPCCPVIVCQQVQSEINFEAFFFNAL